jgi:hypothetical protein
MLGTVERWMSMAADKLAGDPQRVFVCPGNDDQFEVDEILGAATRVELAEGRVVEVDGYQMASTGWSNVTPWNTYREEPEDALLERIRGVASKLTNPPERVILNLHCPPYASGLDDAPGLNDDLTPKHGGHAPEPVGSRAVRTAIEERARAMLERHRSEVEEIARRQAESQQKVAASHGQSDVGYSRLSPFGLKISPGSG